MSEMSDLMRHKIGLGPEPEDGSDDREARDQAAAEAGLPDALAERLRGRTPQELAADAIRVAEVIRQRDLAAGRQSINDEIRRRAR